MIWEVIKDDFLQLQNHHQFCDCDCRHEIKRHLILGRKAIAKLDSVLKSRDITLLIKIRIVKAMIFLSSHERM